VSGNSILSLSLEEAARSPKWGLPIRGEVALQAPILFPRNTRGIRANPEGDGGALRTVNVKILQK